MAIPVAQANGSLAVIDMDVADKRFDQGVIPCFDGHRGPVLDFDFNPLQGQLIASGGDDCVTKIWGIPPDGLKDSISNSLVDLVGHDKKVSCVLHHPTVPYVIATGSADRTVKIWDIMGSQEQPVEMSTIEHEELIQGLAWDKYGELLASTCRDKKCRLIDPRGKNEVRVIKAHEGQRTMKAVFCPTKGPGNSEALATVGFTRQSKRQFRLWDQRKLDTFYAQQNIDQSAGALLPFYDDVTNLLFLAGKGDANVRYYELVDGAPWQFYIDEFRTRDPCRGMCTVPRRILDTTKPEITRMLKLTSDKIVPLSFICPRKSDMFQADLFPAAPSGNTIQVMEGGKKVPFTADMFFGGAKAEFDLISMDPKEKGKSKNAGGVKTVQVKKKKNTAQLQKELDEANKKVAKYEELLTKNNIKF